jgi:hypothetical protein
MTQPLVYVNADLRSRQGEKAADYDDALHVFPADEHIVFYFDVEE